MSCNSAVLSYRTSIGLNPKHDKHYSVKNPSHAEGPLRITTVIEHLKKCGLWSRCNIIEEHSAVDEGDLKETHSQSYIDSIVQLKNQPQELIDKFAEQFDTIYLRPESYEAAAEAVSCARNLATLIAEGKIPNGFALIRPPGHHAQKNEASGFCVFNNVAQAAEAAYNFGSNRILIVDFDVHHGQGIQQSFYEDKRVMYISIHRYADGKFWPHLEESNFCYVGEYSGAGYNVNIPLNETGCSDSDYMTIFWNVIWPIAKCFNPHFVLVAAGFDSCLGDPLGEMNVSPDLFAHLVYHLKGLATGKILLCLEGGYNYHNTAICVERCLRVLLGEAPNPLKKLESPMKSTVTSCLNVISALLPYWQHCFGFYALDGTLQSNWEIHHVESTSNLSRFEQENNEKTGSIDQLKLPQVAAETIRDELVHVTALAYDPRIELHREEIDTGHFECPERTFAIASQLRGSGLLRRCHVLPAREATTEELELIHDRPHVKRMERTAQIDEAERRRDEACFDSMYFCKDSYSASLAAVGSLLECVDALLDESREEGHANNAFALVRPPGHHATPSQAAGFCIFNNVAIAAKYAMDKYALQRVLIVDWDVHHGNGIQDAFYYDPRVLYISIHRHDEGYFYPTNEPKDVENCGEGAGLGYNVNIPFSHKCLGDNDYHVTFNKVVMPIAYEYSPELVIVASGFDAAYGDKLGGYELNAACYAQLTYQLSALAKGRIIVALEGGYTLSAIRQCSEAVVRTLIDGTVPRAPHMTTVSCLASSRRAVRRCTWDTLRRVCEHHSKYWSCLSGFQVKLARELNNTQDVNAVELDESLMQRTKLSDGTESDECAASGGNGSSWYTFPREVVKGDIFDSPKK